MNTDIARGPSTQSPKKTGIDATHLIVALLIAVAANTGSALAAESDDTQAPEMGRNGTPRMLPPTLIDEDAVQATTCQGSARPSRLFVRGAAKHGAVHLDPSTLRLVRNM